MRGRGKSRRTKKYRNAERRGVWLCDHGRAESGERIRTLSSFCQNAGLCCIWTKYHTVYRAPAVFGEREIALENASWLEVV
jgi:hypothetical protein